MVRFLFIIAVFLVAHSAHAQWYSDLSLEYRLGKLTAATHSPNIVNNNFGSGNGTSVEHTFGLNWNALSFPAFDTAFWINGTVGAEQSIGSFTSTNGTFSLAYTTTTLRAMPGVELRTSTLSLAVAPWVDVPIKRTLTETPAISGILYSSMPYGVRVQLGSNKPIVAGLPILFSILGEFDIEAYRQPQLSFADCVSAGVGFKWYFNQPSEKTNEEKPQPIAIAPVVQNAATSGLATDLRAELHFTAHGAPVADGASIAIESRDTLIRQLTMLPRFLLLSEDGRSFASDYVRLAPTKAKDFAIDSLTRGDEIGVARNLLNVLGSRMTKLTDASIAMSGPAPAIDSVERYLETTFHISRRRIQIDRNHADRIWIEPTPLLAPVATQWIERSYDLSNLGIEHHIDGQPTSWQITLRQGSETSLYSSSTMREPKMILRRISSHDSSLVVATLTAVDSSGRSASALDTLHIVQGTVGQTAVETNRFVFLADVSDRVSISNIEQSMKEQDWKRALLQSNTEAGWLERDMKLLLQSSKPLVSSKLDLSNTTGPRVVVVLEK